MAQLFETGDILHTENSDDYWNCTIQNPGPLAIKTIIDDGHDIIEWKKKSPDIVELLCHATGLEIEDIGMELQSSNMMPLRSTTEEVECLIIKPLPLLDVFLVTKSGRLEW